MVFISNAEKYLAWRGIPLELAQAYGVGFSTCKNWKWGRVVFGHTNPAGELVNLYARAVDGKVEKAPRDIRHRHQQGDKGYFNARALVEGQGPLYVCEGAFDALALIAAGAARTLHSLEQT